MKTSISNNFYAFYSFLNEITNRVNHWFRHFVGQDYIIEPVLMESFDSLSPVAQTIRGSVYALLAKLQYDSSLIPEYRYFLNK